MAGPYYVRSSDGSQSLIHQVSNSDTPTFYDPWRYHLTSQSLIHQVSDSDNDDYISKYTAKRAGLNPLSIRSQIQIKKGKGHWTDLGIVSIPYSSGLRFR